MKPILVTFLITAAFCTAAAAEETAPRNVPGAQETTSLGDEVSRILDYNAANNIKNGFSPHRPNYLLPFITSDYNYDRNETEVKFQISMKQRFLRFYGWALYIG
ncbi:MAG TPA: hypothetical protein PLI62_14845, partial [Spirochaetota bacterium]|nr:hypothetical protein [Spirochaetota bacterium]